MAETYHYNIVFLGTNETLDKEHDFLKIVESQRLKGVIITPISETDTVTRITCSVWRESGIPVVLVDRDVKGAQFDGVFVDNQRGSYDGVMELIKAGHERIAIITGPETSKPGKDRCQGYLQGHWRTADWLSLRNMLPAVILRLPRHTNVPDGFWDLRNRPQPSLHPITFPLWDVLSI